MLKNKVLIFTKVSGVNRLVAKKRLNKDNIVKYQKVPHVIDLQYPYFEEKKKIVYAFDIDNGQITQENIIPEDHETSIDIIIAKNTVKQLVSTIQASVLNWNSIIFLIMGVVSGLMTGFALGPMLGFGG